MLSCIATSEAACATSEASTAATKTSSSSSRTILIIMSTARCQAGACTTGAASRVMERAERMERAAVGWPVVARITSAAAVVAAEALRYGGSGGHRWRHDLFGGG
jgi:hypothetical protein